MFNAIRYWFQSKQYELSAWVRRPRNVETAIQQVITGMEQLGIRVVDASVYPKSEKGEVVGAAVIIAGYIPEKALMFTVKFNHGTFDDYKFSIQGQIKQGEWSKCGGHERNFPNVARHPGEGESTWVKDQVFDINTYTSCNDMSSKTSQEKVIYGMAFFKKFLDEYGVLVRKGFDSSVHLWFVPEYSDELEALEKKNGQRNRVNYVGFNSHVMAKFPVDFFCKTQRA